MSISRLWPLLIASCAAACSSSQADSPVRTEAGADGSEDVVVADALHDTDVVESPRDAEAGPEGGDGGEQDSGLPAHCATSAALPPWAELASGDFQLVVHTSAMDLFLAAIADGMMRLHPVAKGQGPSSRSWALPSPAALDPEAVVTGTFVGAQICTAWMRLEVTADGRMVVSDREGAVLIEDGASGGWEQTQGADGGAGYEVRVRRVAHPAEHFYGFGERTGPLDRRGRRMVFWNTDAYDSTVGGWLPFQDPLYASIPFFLGLNDGRAHGSLGQNPEEAAQCPCVESERHAHRPAVDAG